MGMFRKTMVAGLAFLVLMMGNGGVISYAAELAAAPGATVLQNDLVKITVDNATGRFGIRTVQGQPIRKNDQQVNMLFRGDDPETSFTTFRINGTDYIFGNPYKFAPQLRSEVTKPKIVENRNGTRQIETIWSIEGVRIKQILLLYMDVKDRNNAGNVSIRYEVLNQSGSEVELGSRILLDTMVAGKDGPEFQIGTTYKSPLTVERKLVHDPAALGVPEADIAYYKLPPYWVMRDNLDLTNPLATNVVAYGFNNIAEDGINIVDEMIVGHWNGLANTKWDYEVNKNLDFTRDTNKFGTADSAVAMYWMPESVGAGQTVSFETVYGLGEVIEPDKVFSIRFLDPPQQLATLPDNSAYENEGIFDIHAEIENLPAFQMEHSEIRLNMTLESGLSFVKLDEQGRIVRDEDGKPIQETVSSKELVFKKSATPEEAEQGILPKYKPGDAITASFKVVASGRKWPTTRQYLLTVRSPQTQAKLETLPGAADEGVLADYESSRAGFMLLPAIGEAAATYAYAVSPKELYSQDVKYVTVNLTNIEAYNTGGEHTEPNFDLYFRETVTGKRYKVPVKESVILQPTDSGLTGDMRITYRNGELVNEVGEVLESDFGPELPIGEYQVEIDYTDASNEDPEQAALYDIVTPQTFLVTDNDVARIREANLIAVYKQTFDLNYVPIHASEEYLKDINEVFAYNPFKPGDSLSEAKRDLVAKRAQLAIKSRAVDSALDVEALLDEEALEEVPLYNYRIFDSEAELEGFFDNRDDLALLVSIAGMVKEVGTGQDKSVVVDTETEPAIINDAVAYSGKDLVFVRGHLEVFNQTYDNNPLLDTLFVKGDGTLSVANSGFVFHRGEWTLDFFNNFDKDLEAEVERPGEEEEENDNAEDDSLNGSLKWAMGELSSRLNPMRQILLSEVYFNAQTIFNVPGLVVGGFGFQFYETTLRPGGVSFGGFISFKVVAGEIKSVVFNDKGFVGVDAALMFELGEKLGMIVPGAGGGNGELTVVHYEQAVEGVSNEYGIEFEADLENIAAIGVELSFKQVEDGRILPDVIGFRADLESPGVLITGATYLAGVRGALRELADTIAGGTSDDPFPLTLEAGATIRFGQSPAFHYGDIDLTLKRTGIKIEGSLAFSIKDDPSEDDLIPMLSQALLEAQWLSPWFVRLSAEVDVHGWNIIIGKASIFVGQNLEKNRIDFEGFLGAKVQIPEAVPIVGGMPLSSVFLGINNDKVWGKVGILLISLGITYHWGGGVEFYTSGEQLPDGLIHMVVEDPEKGPQLVVIGQGIETVATSLLNPETETQGIVYREVAEGVQVIEQGSMNVGIGGIEVSNGGRLHDIPMDKVNGNAVIEVKYDDPELPELVLRNEAGAKYPLVYDNTNTNPEANAFTQFIPAASSQDGTDSNKAYLIVPHDERLAGGSWTLASAVPVETKLFNVPTTSTLSEVSLQKDDTFDSRFTASWSVDHALPGDTVSLYLAADSVAEEKTVIIGDTEVLEPGDAGLLIAQDVPVGYGGGVDGQTTNGRLGIDVSDIGLLGDTEDIRGLLRQGSYYLRAELKSAIGYETKTSEERFELVDPLAPGEVADVVIEPAGNGMFALSFAPSAVKPGHESYEASYVIEAFAESDEGVAPYENFAEQLMTKDELGRYWNPDNGRYEGIPVGGWTAISLQDGIDDPSPEERYIGLETGRKYMIGVSAATKPAKEADKHENLHFSGRTDSLLTLLPVPAHPKLKGAVSLAYGSRIDVLSSQTTHKISIESDQRDIEIEALYNGESLGKTVLTNEGGSSKGELAFDRFVTDGTYGIELLARNTRTKDRKITMLYLTVDTIAPILYLERPVTGDRTQDGKIRLQGRTTNDASLTVNGTNIPIDSAGNGSFNADIPVLSDEATVRLDIIARDEAGNENRASVEVTNDSYQAPAALVLRPVKLTTDESRKLEASLKLPDGRNAAGEVSYKLVPIPDSAYEELLSFDVYAGDAVSVSADGQLTAQAVGASLIRAEYRVSDDVLLKADLSVAVELSEPQGLGELNVYTTAIANETGKTRISVTNAGDLTGHQLVYRVVTADSSEGKPELGDDLGQWALLPANGVIDITGGSKVIVAKRMSYTKEAIASTGLISPNVFAGNGGPGGPIGPIGPGPGTPGEETPADPDAGTQELLINGTPVLSEWEGDRLIATITAEAFAEAGLGDLVISSADTSMKNLLIVFDNDVSQSIAAAGKRVLIDLPIAKLTITPERLNALGGKLEISLDPNGQKAKQSAATVAQSLQASLLGGGQGVTIATTLPISGAADEMMKARIAIPADVRIQDITAVVLQGPDGEWTPLPWELDMQSNQAYAVVALTGEGSLFFIQNRKSFADVPATFWGRAAIEDAASSLLVLGKGANRFDPEGRVTRAEFPTMLLRAAGLMNQQAGGSFTDVNQSDWFYNSVGIAARLGIAAGLSDGSFAPSSGITRIEGMTMAGRLLEAVGISEEWSDAEIDEALAGFADGEHIPAWARKPAAMAIHYGIIRGSNNRIDPDGVLTRAQAATIAVSIGRLLSGSE